MADFEISKNIETHGFAANLRCVCSGIVTVKVKDDGIRATEKHGLFKLSEDKEIMQRMNKQLESLKVQQRMKLPRNYSL